MITEKSNILKFFIYSPVEGKVEVGDVEDYEEFLADVFKKQTRGNYYAKEKNTKLVFGRKGYDHLTYLRYAYGPQLDARVIVEMKGNKDLSEEWFVLSDVPLNLYTLSFEDETKEVSIDIAKGSLLETLEARWDDEIDMTSETLPEAPFVSLYIEPRRILKRTRLVPTDIEVDCSDDQGATARAVPLSIQSPGYTSQSEFIGGVANVLANSVNDNYATLSNAGGTIISNAPQDFIYKLSGTIEIKLTALVSSGYIKLDLVRYHNGQDLNFKEVILNLDQESSIQDGDVLSYTFEDYEIQVSKGDSIGIMTLSDIGFGVMKYTVTDITDLSLVTDTPFKPTYTKALKLKDAFQRACDLALGEESVEVTAPCFDENGTFSKTGEVLLVHGSWLRNMPQVINEGKEDETRVQSLFSLKKLYESCKILHPMRYDEIKIGQKKSFYVGLEKETQLNYTSIRLEDPFTKELIPVSNLKREEMEEGYFGTIKIGSTTSGSNYEEINNLYSICGYSEWKTIHKKIDESYEVTTETRTGAEDIEIARLLQWEDYPDQDTSMQNDWFLVHAKKQGPQYVPVRWQALYEEKPKNTYDADSNYNWIFRPRNLLDNHGWKVKSFLTEKISDELIFNGSNCSPSLVTKRAGEPEAREGGNVKHTSLDKAFFVPVSYSFSLVVDESIILQLNSYFRGVDSKFGLIEFKSGQEILYGGLLEADTNRDGKFKLIEALK